MSYHKFVSPCIACDGTGNLQAEEYATVLKCAACRGVGKEEYGSFETFFVDEHMLRESRQRGDSWATETGWYWWACFPGCLPDGDAEGPFATEQEAINNAQEG